MIRCTLSYLSLSPRAESANTLASLSLASLAPARSPLICLECTSPVRVSHLLSLEQSINNVQVGQSLGGSVRERTSPFFKLTLEIASYSAIFDWIGPSILLVENGCCDCHKSLVRFAQLPPFLFMGDWGDCSDSGNPCSIPIFNILMVFRGVEGNETIRETRGDSLLLRFAMSPPSPPSSSLTCF